MIVNDKTTNDISNKITNDLLDLLLKTELPSGVSCSLKILESKVN